MKKLISVILALVISISSLGSSPMLMLAANNTETITLNNAELGKTYKKTVPFSQMYQGDQEPDDYYKAYSYLFAFTLPKCGKVSIKITSSSGCYLKIQPSDSQIYNFVYGNIYEAEYDGNFQLYRLNTSETYFAKDTYIAQLIFGEEFKLNGDSAQFTFCVDYQSANESYLKDRNHYYNSAASSISTGLNKTYKGCLIFAYNSTVENSELLCTDFYKINIKKAGVYDFSISSDGPIYAHMYLPDGNLYEDFGFYGGLEYDVIDGYEEPNRTETEEFYMKKGTYYLRLGPCTNTSAGCAYKIKLNTAAVFYKTKAPVIKKTKYSKKYSDIYVLAKKKTNRTVEYQYQLAENKKFTKKKKNAKWENDYWYFTVGKKKKTYYVRVRTITYDTFGKKHYSPWSKTKKVKVK